MLLVTGLVIGLVIGILVVNLVIFNITATRITEGTPISHAGSGNRALVVIDIQEGTTGSESYVKNYRLQSGELIENLNLLTEEAETEGCPIIYIISEVANPLINILNSTLAKGSPGVEMDRRLEIRSDHIVTKRKNDSFTNPELDSILTRHRIDRLTLVGLDAAECVYHTALAALNRGYKIEVVEEAIISKTDADKAEALQNFSELGAEIVSLHNTETPPLGEF